MNKQIKPIVYEILDKDKLAREDTGYLIQQALMRLLDVNQGTAFGQVIQGMSYKGISFEAITRAKRKYLEEHPETINPRYEEIRRTEEGEYFMEYANHIPRID